MFFLDWLVWRIKTEDLAVNHKHSATLTILNFRERYKKAPYLRRIREIFGSLSEQGFEEDSLLDYDVVCTYKTRFESDHFVKLIESLQRKRYLDYYRMDPVKSKVKNNWASMRFAQCVGRFIHAQPKKRITQRMLLRHFSNKRKKDLAEIYSTLVNNFRIRAKRHGKSIVYRVGQNKVGA